MSEECQRCKEVGKDRDTLWMSCKHDMDELNMPFRHVSNWEKADIPHKFYTLRTCKSCRGFWMGMIKVWFDVPEIMEKI